VSSVLPLAASSGLIVIGIAVCGALVLLLFLFRAEDRGEAQQRAEAEQTAEALRRAEAERRG
jgi:mannose/fructose/N-acetylgalactosamine-specific phosphotransferase system component IIC